MTKTDDATQPTTESSCLNTNQRKLQIASLSYRKCYTIEHPPTHPASQPINQSITLQTITMVHDVDVSVQIISNEFISFRLQFFLISTPEESRTCDIPFYSHAEYTDLSIDRLSFCEPFGNFYFTFSYRVTSGMNGSSIHS